LIIVKAKKSKAEHFELEVSFSTGKIQTTVDLETQMT